MALSLRRKTNARLNGVVRGWVSKEWCYLVYAYAKNVAADLTQEQLLFGGKLHPPCQRHHVRLCGCVITNKY